MAEVVEIEPTPEVAQDQIEQWAAILAELQSPATTADFLNKLAAELRTLQPASN